MGTDDDDDEKLTNLSGSDTVPPPAGAEDAYSGATVVREAPEELVQEMLKVRDERRQAAEKAQADATAKNAPEAVELDAEDLQVDADEVQVDTDGRTADPGMRTADAAATGTPETKPPGAPSGNARAATPSLASSDEMDEADMLFGDLPDPITSEEPPEGSAESSDPELIESSRIGAAALDLPAAEAAEQAPVKIADASAADAPAEANPAAPDTSAAVSEAPPSGPARVSAAPTMAMQRPEYLKLDVKPDHAPPSGPPPKVSDLLKMPAASSADEQATIPPETAGGPAPEVRAAEKRAPIDEDDEDAMPTVARESPLKLPKAAPVGAFREQTTAPEAAALPVAPEDPDPEGEDPTMTKENPASSRRVVQGFGGEPTPASGSSPGARMHRPPTPISLPPIADRGPGSRSVLGLLFADPKLRMLTILGILGFVLLAAAVIALVVTSGP